MNKQKIIEELEKSLTYCAADYDSGYDNGIGYAIALVKQLDEPKKPVVPQFVADWFEDREHNLELYVSNLCVNFQLHKEQLNDEFANWYSNFENEPIQTLVKMKLYGYEVEKEKFYTAKLKSTGEHLHYDERYNKVNHTFADDYTVKKLKTYHFTKDTLLKYSAWENDFYSVIEVEE